jgi:hypothetical protein
MKFIVTLVYTFSYLFCSSQNTESDLKYLIDSAIDLNIQSCMKDSGNSIYKNILINDGLLLMNENEFPYQYLSNNYGIAITAFCGKCPESEKFIKKGMIVWKILSVLRKNQLIITVARFTTQLDGKYLFSYGSSTRTTFEYSCRVGKWKQIKFTIIRH